MILSIMAQRVVLAVTIVPSTKGWLQVAGVTALTIASAGVGAAATGFIHPRNDFATPDSILRPLSALVVPGVVEEIFWRAALLPSPSTASSPAVLYSTALLVLVAHVVSHPIFSATVYPRGREVFSDPRFLGLAAIVLGGSTVSYIVSGGSVWAAAITHGIPVMLWRDFFGGEEALQGRGD